MKNQLRSVLGLLFLGAVAESMYVQGAPANGEPPVMAGKGSLTIAGEGYWHRNVFQDGEHPSLSAYDNAGELLPDGSYQYEFRSFPEGASSSPRQRDLMRNQGKAMSQGRGKSPVTNTVSGSFEVQGGQLILP